jgi:hypothetical protein
VRLIDLTGKRFGLLVVLRRSDVPAHNMKWDCLCDCGNEKAIIGAELKAGKTKSCGCRKGFRSHGDAHHGRVSPVYQSWRSMRARCLSPTHKNYKHYGGRGITICERWESYENFRLDMGPKPPGTSLDRINNDGNYEPSNCRWATQDVQVANSRVPRFIEYNGQTKSMSDWARSLGLSPSAIRRRLNSGIPLNEVFASAHRVTGWRARKAKEAHAA